ncbi:transaldolase [Candidatus Woesearchaeota archaeon]|nr:transaldolase [Candidatus Woesearchaeota archaeon]
MELFVDSASLDEISHALDTGVLDGVTTNPSKMKEAVELVKKQGKKVSLTAYIKQLCRMCKGLPVSLEVIGASYEDLVREGLLLHRMFNPVAKNVVVKIPVNPQFDTEKHRVHDGIKAIRSLSKKGVRVNCTLVFTPEQALLAAKAGAQFVSPFCGRLDDYIRSSHGMKFSKGEYYPAEGKKRWAKQWNDQGVVSGIDLVAQCVEIFDVHGIKTKVLAASIRNVRQLREAAVVGAHCATMSLETLEAALVHPKTEQGMKKFSDDVVPEYASLFKK